MKEEAQILYDIHNNEMRRMYNEFFYVDWSGVPTDTKEVWRAIASKFRTATERRPG